MFDLVSRKDAVNHGLTRYFTGSPCPNGHVSERMVSTRACVLCLREKKKDWSRLNPEKVTEQKRLWRGANLERARLLNLENQKKHREKANERNRRYAKLNSEKLREKNEIWSKLNPGRVLARNAKYRANKLLATPKWADFDKIRRAYELAAEYRAKGIDAEVDHIIPLQGRNVCGLHVQGNFQIINSGLNKIKSNSFKEI